MELKPNMYVRHKPLLSRKYVKINKIKEIEEKENCLHIWLEDKDLITEKYLIKASYNIIDILEENDYVNGLRVEKNKYGELYTSYVYYGGDIGKQCEVYTTWLKELKEDMIYSVVTHEQFESIKYSLEG